MNFEPRPLGGRLLPPPSTPEATLWGSPKEPPGWRQLMTPPTPTAGFMQFTSTTPLHHGESGHHNSAQKQDQSDSGKRGRPRADHITHLILEGTSSPSGIKCRVCNRVFPREKSLQAHLRTHTGERPYICDYPGCTRAFTQSGQLKTHQRLHAGEKPFICSSPGCGNRYTHANRTCPAHPYHKPQRSADLVLQPNLSSGENTEDVRRWLDNYRRERMDKSTPAKLDLLSTPSMVPSATTLSPSSPSIVEMAQDLCRRRNRTKRVLATELEQENVAMSPRQIAKPCSTATTLSPRRKTLGDITPKRDNNILAPEDGGNIPAVLSPVKSLKPKKRWMKTAVQEKIANDDENLAMPIRWNETEPVSVVANNKAAGSPQGGDLLDNWSAVTALMEMSSSSARPEPHNNQQPLNLSTNRVKTPCND